MPSETYRDSTPGSGWEPGELDGERGCLRLRSGCVPGSGEGHSYGLVTCIRASQKTSVPARDLVTCASCPQMPQTWILSTSPMATPFFHCFGTAVMGSLPELGPVRLRSLREEQVADSAMCPPKPVLVGAIPGRIDSVRRRAEPAERVGDSRRWTHAATG